MSKTTYVASVVAGLRGVYSNNQPVKDAIETLAGQIYDISGGGTDLSDLETTEQGSLVGSINEIVTSITNKIAVNNKVVSTVAELEAAVAAQTAGQAIFIEHGTYTLTESLEIPLAANGGSLMALGAVEIVGAADADEAIKIDPAVATGTFEYTLQDINSIKGGADKIGVHVLNTAIAKKIILYLKRTSLNDNGTGKALTAVNSDGSNAIRIYADGPAEIDSIAYTPKDNGDIVIFNGYNIEENIVVAAVDCTASFMFKNCKLPHEGVTGGHANNVCSVANCWTEEVAFVPVIPDASDFPDAFNPTIYPAS